MHIFLLLPPVTSFYFHTSRLINRCDGIIGGYDGIITSYDVIFHCYDGKNPCSDGINFQVVERQLK